MSSRGLRADRRVRTIRRIAGVALAVTLAVTLAACSSPATPSEADTDVSEAPVTPIAMKAGVYPALFVSLPIWVAQDQGFFSDNAVDVELVEFTSGPNMISAISSNSIDVMQNGATLASVTNSKGAAFRLLAPTVPVSIYNMFGTPAALDDCPFAGEPYPEPIKCAEGKRIGIVALASESYLVAVSVLAEVGLTPEDVTFVPAGAGPAIVAAMQAGQIDYAFGEDTATASAVDTLKIAEPVTDLKKNGVFSDWIGNALWASQDRLDAEPEKFMRFAKAIEQANAWLEDPANKAAAVKVYQDNAPAIDDVTANALLDLVPGYFGSEVTCQSIININEWLVGTTQIEEGSLPDDCEALVWTEVIQPT